MDKHKNQLTHARHDPAHCLAPLFRSLQKGDRKRFKLDVVYVYGDDQRIEFSGPEPLGADDLRILQGLIAMAGPKGLILSPSPSTEAGQQLRLALEVDDPKWDVLNQNALVIKGSYGELAREIGYANPNDTRPIRDCIERLWKVSIIVQSGKKRQGFRLLSEYASNEYSGALHVALNPRIAQAILGERPHARIELAEVRGLSGDAARIIHQRLCGWIDSGKSGRVGIDTLTAYAYPAVASAVTTRKRKERARGALEEIKAVGWTVDEYAEGKYQITRPPIDVNVNPR